MELSVVAKLYNVDLLEENKVSRLLYAEPDEDDGITEEPTAMMSRLHASNPNVLTEDPTDEDFCRVDANSEYEARSELSSVDATGEDDEDAADSTPTPDNLSVGELKERLKWMTQLFVSADAMGITSKDVIGLRSMQREFREELGRKQQKSMLDFLSLPSTYGFHS
ncbi:hypothetical protein PI124_g8308 [Phytophthora idaei]|nr:hypothetical protein PI124_g8308 [Phytophthora idaei]